MPTAIVEPPIDGSFDRTCNESDLDLGTLPVLGGKREDCEPFDSQIGCAYYEIVNYSRASAVPADPGAVAQL